MTSSLRENSKGDDFHNIKRAEATGLVVYNFQLLYNCPLDIYHPIFGTFDTLILGRLPPKN